MSVKKYETVNTQVKCEETLHPDAHMFLCQELIEGVPDASVFIMTQLSLKAGMKRWKGKWRAADKSETNQMNLIDIFKPKHYRDLN